MTALHWAAITGAVEAVQLLLTFPIFVDAETQQGQTPLMLAKSLSYDNICELIAEYKLSRNVKPAQTEWQKQQFEQLAQGMLLAADDKPLQEHIEFVQTDESTGSLVVAVPDSTLFAAPSISADPPLPPLDLSVDFSQIVMD
eukprot:m.75210 g.75210  ORF g.75210 m.75210 type:complete len:142 (-) comp50380_c0_seq2:164-589(-)